MVAASLPCRVRRRAVTHRLNDRDSDKPGAAGPPASGLAAGAGAGTEESRGGVLS